MNATVNDDRPPLVWSRVLMFALTLAVAVIVVPWYGFTHGFSVAGWVWFAVLLYANGLAITTGYHRLWSHKTFDAHWSVRLVLMLFGSMALQNSVLHWAANHRSHHQYVDDNERDPYSAGPRAVVLAHRLDAARLPERSGGLINGPGPAERPDPRFPAPLLPAARARHEHPPAARARLAARRPVGRVPAGGRAAPRRQPPLHVPHQFASRTHSAASRTATSTARATTAGSPS